MSVRTFEGFTCRFHINGEDIFTMKTRTGKHDGKSKTAVRLRIACFPCLYEYSVQTCTFVREDDLKHDQNNDGWSTHSVVWPIFSHKRTHGRLHISRNYEKYDSATSMTNEHLLRSNNICVKTYNETSYGINIVSIGVFTGVAGYAIVTLAFFS